MRRAGGERRGPVLAALALLFAAAVLGGLGSIPGSILGALLLGYSETIIAFNVSIEWSQIVSVAAVLITLILRPAATATSAPSQSIREIVMGRSERRALAEAMGEVASAFRASVPRTREARGDDG